jgi:hypothetical protein
MEREDLLDHQEDQEILALRDEKAKLVVRCVLHVLVQRKQNSYFSVKYLMALLCSTQSVSQ